MTAFKYELLLLLVSVLWGTTFVAQQIGMERGIGPFSFNALRFALGCLALLPVIRWRHMHPAPADTPSHTHVPVGGSILAGVFMFAAVNFQQVGLKFTSSANAGFITSLYVVFVPILGIFLGHRPSRHLWAGLAVCVAGLYLLSFNGPVQMQKGDLMVLVCAFLWAGQILTLGHVARDGDPVKIAVIQFVVVAILSAGAGLILEPWSVAALCAGAGAVAYAGILSVAVAFTFQVICQKRCPPAPAAIIMSSEAVFAGLAGYVVLGQTLSSRAILGCVLLLGGVLYAQLAPMCAKWAKAKTLRAIE